MLLCLAQRTIAATTYMGVALGKQLIHTGSANPPGRSGCGGGDGRVLELGEGVCVPGVEESDLLDAVSKLTRPHSAFKRLSSRRAAAHADGCDIQRWR